MTTTLDSVIERLIRAHVHLLHCQARLTAETDPRALPDLHRALGRLRNLLRPLRGLPGIDHLEDAARVLRRRVAIECDRAPTPPTLGIAQSAPLQTYARVAQSDSFFQLLRLLDTLVPLLRTNAHYGVMGKLDRRVRKALDRQARHLRQALAASGSERHRLRLLIKRLRYAIEAYPKQVPTRPEASRALKRAQDALGHWQVLQKRMNPAEQRATLEAHLGQWQAELLQAEHLADQALARLRVAMGKPKSPKLRKK